MDFFFEDQDKCQGFLLQRPVSFSSEVAKINYVIRLLGRALAWAEAVSAHFSFHEFSQLFNSVFDHPNWLAGEPVVVDYSVDFWILAADTQWDEAALKAVFLKGLNKHLKDQ